MVVLGIIGGLLALVAVVLAVSLVGPDSKDGKDGGGGEDGRTKAPATASASTASVASSPAVDRGPVEDVKITSCEVNPSTRWPSAGLTITNNSGRTSTYLVSVEFVSASGTRLAEGAGISNGLAAGQRAQVKAGSLTQVSEEVSCKVLKVDRIAP